MDVLRSLYLCLKKRLNVVFALLVILTMCYIFTARDTKICSRSYNPAERSTQSTKQRLPKFSWETARTIKIIKNMNGHRYPNKTRLEQCGQLLCNVTDGDFDTSNCDLALFDEMDVRYFGTPPRKGTELWGFYSKEAENRIDHRTELEWDGLFNYSCIYDKEDVEGSSHIFRAIPARIHPPATEYFKPREKMRPVRALWFVSHCTAPHDKHHIFSAREEYVLELSKYITIDVYTSPKRHFCRQRLGGLVKNTSIDGEPELTDYMFYLSFENNLCKDYITEKLWKVLESNSTTIPIALGGSSMEDYEYVAPLNSFIHVKNFTSPEALAKHLKFVSQDDNAFHYYNQWRNEFRLISTHIHNHGDFICYFCRLAYERPTRVWNTFSKDYGSHKCKDVSTPELYCPYYNLTCH